jgi:hypothetical protein
LSNSSQAGIHQQLDALPGGELSFLVLPLDPVFSAPQLRFPISPSQLLELM